MADSEPPRDDQDIKSDEHREEEQAPHPAQSEHDQPEEVDAPAPADTEPAEHVEPTQAPEEIEEEGEEKELEAAEQAAPPEASAPVPENVEDDSREDSREDEPQSPRTEQPAPPRISLPEDHVEQQDRPPTESSDHTVPPSPSIRLRTDSQSTAATNATARTTTRSSLVFVVTALETIAASKDARKTKKLADTTQKALSAIKGDGDPSTIDPEILFEPLQLATEANTIQVVTTALDCIGKLISYSYFSYPSEQAAGSPEQPALIDRAIDTICDCFQMDATHADIELQILKSLLSAILNDKIVVHGAGLLKAVRQTYNIFLHSKSSNNQQVAQGALTQMVGTVFERVKSRLRVKEARINLSKSSLHKNSSGDVSPEAGDIGGVDANGDGENEAEASEGASDLPVEKDESAKITLQSFENRKSFDDARIADNAPTLVTRNKNRRTLSRANTLHSNDGQEGTDPTEEEEEDEIYVKDAYLVFRAMCRLSTKAVPLEEAQNVRSQSMRSKLLSLHIIHTILHNNVAVFVSPYATIRSSNTAEPTTFVQAIKQYLCLSLSRNGASSLKQVFEISCEIFWLMLHQLRVMLKKEIEVFMKEIYLAVLEKRSAPAFQKQYILQILHRLGSDPRALVEIYLNYDCDRSALDNHFQKIVEHLARICSTPVAITPQQQLAYQEHHAKQQAASPTDWQTRATLPPSLATVSIQAGNEMDQGFPPEYSLKQESLEALVEILRSLVNWSQQSISDAAATLRVNDGRASVEDIRDSMDTRANLTASPAIDSPNGPGTPVPEDDPSQLERAKQRKTALNHAIRQFNYKPKKGMKLLLKDKFIASDAPEDIARFFLSNDQIDKKALGEYLGEGDEENVKIMHAFVDQMDFTRTRFVDALRRFLQSFRLPGEAQKIDRFMLKFAERYMAGNPSAFANADTAYVLAYSVIMLNTDQHSTKMKGARMTPEDFIKNNRGINDNADLPDDYLKGIYEEIANNEIVLDTERETAANLGQLPQPNQGGLGNIGQAFANVGRDLQREAYIQASEQMANRTEQLYKSLLRAQRRGPSRFPVSKFIPASSFRHVGPMFEVTWMPFLTALSGPAQNTHNLETIKLCMEGQKLAIRIACLFDLEDPRQAFVTSLSRFTNLYNLTEMKAKNIEALYALLDVAQHEGNLLKESWREILTCISQLDRFQLISAGIEDTAVPDLMRSNSSSSKASTQSRKSLQASNKNRPRSGTAALYHSEAAVESRSADMVRAVDRIFTNTANLSGEAIVQFVRALTQVSWQEIQSSGQSESPRTYSLQKLVEISSYNMNRVRFEWTNIWQILGEHFNQVGCHTNTNVVFFALNSLRQLSMKFLEIGELPGFKFQKDFLKPFEHIMKNTSVVPVKDMVLRCLIQMIQARGENIRSGWRTMFGVFTVAAKEPYEGIVNLAFDNITQVYNTRFGVVISQGAFADLVVCLTEFSKNHKFQRKSLQAIETLKSTVPKMLRTPECPLSIDSDKPKDEPQAAGVPKQPTRQTQEEQFWFPVLFAYHDVLMTGEDLEVRSRALTYLFDTLQQYGAAFPREFWDTLWRQILYPIFMVLRSKSEMSNALNHEELTVWLSTTFIQALRHMIALFTHFFEALEYMLDRFLELLALCICQENDTLARIGSNCLQQLVHQNVTKFSEEHWEKIVSAFVDLFQRTEATALFSAATAGSYTPTINGGGSKTSRAMSDTTSMSDLPLDSDDRSDIEDPNALGINGLMSPRRGSAAVSDDGTNGSPRTDLEDYKPQEGIQQAPVVVTTARRRFFNQIITKCVLQLLMIETVNELFSNDDVYAQIPSPQLLRLMMLLKKSYQFAKRFNEDRELRTKLFREGFMRQPPNLLKQESGSAAVYVSILFRMYHDTSSERRLNRANTEQALIPLCVDIVSSYIHLDEETQQRNIVTWRPVVIDVLDGYAGFPEQDFDKHVKVFAPLVVGLLNRDMGLELQRSVQGLLQRILEVKVGIETSGLVVERGSPMGERRPSVFSRRGSKAGR